MFWKSMRALSPARILAIVGVLYLGTFLASSSPAEAQAYYHGEGVCVRYCDSGGDSYGGSDRFDDNSVPARIGTAINHGIRGVVSGFFSAVSALLRPPQSQPNGFFGTGVAGMPDDVDLTPPSGSVTAYASAGAQANAAARDPSGCVFDGERGCTEGVGLDYRTGKIGHMMFVYPPISAEQYRQISAKMSADDQRTFGRLIKVREAAEIELQGMVQIYKNAKKGSGDERQLDNLEQEMTKRKVAIDDANKKLVTLIDRVELH